VSKACTSATENRHRCKPSARCALGRPLDRIFGAIDAEHASRRPDQPRCENRNVAGTGADVEDMHSGTDAGAAEDLFGELTPEGRLHRQSAQFGLGMAEDVRLCRRVMHETLLLGWAARPDGSKPHPETVEKGIRPESRSGRLGSNTGAAQLREAVDIDRQQQCVKQQYRCEASKIAVRDEGHVAGDCHPTQGLHRAHAERGKHEPRSGKAYFIGERQNAHPITLVAARKLRPIGCVGTFGGRPAVSGLSPPHSLAIPPRPLLDGRDN
jgi:hypothetical protein